MYTGHDSVRNGVFGYPCGRGQSQIACGAYETFSNVGGYGYPTGSLCERKVS